MEQIKQLIEILEQTPEMALWAMGMYFLYILLKLASWIYALKIVTMAFIKRFFDYKDKRIKNEIGARILRYFEQSTIDSVPEDKLIELLQAIKKPSLTYIHNDDLNNAIKLLNESKNNV